MIHNDPGNALATYVSPATQDCNREELFPSGGHSSHHAPLFADPFFAPTIDGDRASDSNRDLYAHDDLENEWWYYHGQLAHRSRSFGFHLAFFRRRTDRIRLAQVIPVRLAREQLRFAHFAIVDVNRRQFQYGQQRSLLADAGACSKRFSVWIRNWRAEENNGVHQLTADIRGAQIELHLTPLKPLVRQGQDGFFPKCSHGRSTYVSIPRMRATGQLSIDGESLDVTGEAWMDREYGDFRFSDELNGWDWFAIHLDNASELLVYRLRDVRGNQTDYSMAALIDAGGKTHQLGANQFTLLPLKYWQSPHTGILYPVAWQFQSDALAAQLQIVPLVRCCELDTRGSTGVNYWEGPVRAQGRLLTRSVSGNGYLELAGYSGNRAIFGQYDFASDNVGLFAWISNEIRLRRSSPCVRLCDDQDDTEFLEHSSSLSMQS